MNESTYKICAVIYACVVGAYVMASLFIGLREWARTRRAVQRARLQRAVQLRRVPLSGQAGAVAAPISPERAGPVSLARPSREAA